MLKLTDLTCFYNKEFNDANQLIKSQQESLGYAWWLQEHLAIQVIKHAAFERMEVINKVKFYFFKGSNRFGYLSLKTIRHLRSDTPDILLFQGLVFPAQVLLLRVLLGRKLVIIAQHHGEQPFAGVKRLLQILADKCINAYIFTSLGNAQIWENDGVIRNQGKCYEIQEASSGFEKLDKDLSKAALGFTGDWNFLWVGRLNANKDPLAVMVGFEKYIAVNPAAKLYCIFQTEELLNDLTAIVNKNEVLKNAVYLIGKINHDDLPCWYSAADIFISGSHREGSGYALIEAMSCGCIPVVTDIPTFRKITDDGRLALLYEAGNSEHLFESLESLQYPARAKMSETIVEYFKKELSFNAIAGKLYELCSKLTENVLYH